MSRSYKRAIIKDKGLKDIYWKIVRSRINQHVKKFLKEPDLEEVTIPEPKEIINDYSFCDFVNDYENILKDSNPIDGYLERQIKYRRK